MEGKESLRLLFEPDDDGTGKLIVRVSTNGFAGVASAWFGTEQLEEFAAHLAAYPLPVPGPTIAGDFFSKEKRGELDQEHVGIEVYPVGSRGQIGVQVRRATESWQHDRPQAQHAVQVELLTTYERLKTFSGDLRAILQKNVPEAVLEREDLE